MEWRKEYMDLMLVPAGLFIMFAYHLYLLHKCIKAPDSTVIGYENNCRKIWVKRMLEIDLKDRGQCFGVISSTISTSTFLASISLTLGSVIGTWVASSSETNIFKLHIIYGDTSSSIISIKYISILSCFLVAFASFLQCARNYVHANFLMSMPNSDVPVEYVQKAVTRATACWTVGLHSIYFATALMLWIFGPIPFFASCVFMVLVLNFLDTKTSKETHNFAPSKSRNLLKKIGEDVSAVAGAVGLHHHVSAVAGAVGLHHHERSHGAQPPAVVM